jgi:hypothetical protein
MEQRGIGRPPPPPPAPITPTEEKLNYIIQTLASIMELVMPEKAQKQIVFKHTVDPLQGIIEHKRVPLIKTAKTITIHWPPGCNALVEVAVGYSQDKRLLPEEGYLALDDTTPTWVVNKDIESDTLWAEIKNGDSVNAHTISVIVNYEEA